jgi:hypothetical protein
VRSHHAVNSEKFFGLEMRIVHGNLLFNFVFYMKLKIEEDEEEKRGKKK